MLDDECERRLGGAVDDEGVRGSEVWRKVVVLGLVCADDDWMIDVLAGSDEE